MNIITVARKPRIVKLKVAVVIAKVSKLFILLRIFAMGCFNIRVKIIPKIDRNIINKTL